ncbi:MAG TPA: xanthine dehydrogenase family protein molybdopterin-binding subunit [Thermoanaerobaculia bacterium]|jgi:xanthine dehydrogenase YagR molybdenum-binding subunit|nr:xanthine dehydrogenase family protein molybdopterin-binding subunit [Thermoanaerobaculia bacterium]
MVDYSWPAAKDRKLIGQRISRLDGPAKVTGTAKYTYDLRFPGMLYARFVRCPHAHARVTRIDTSAAESMAGVKAVQVIQKEGTEIQWALDEIVAVAAVSEQTAEDAIRAVKVEYEVLPHFVTEESLADATTAGNTRPAQEEVVGDPDAAMTAAAVKIKGTYGMPLVAHNCLESHGQVTMWEGDQLTAWCSTQAVSAVAQQLAEGLKIPASSVRVRTEYMGGGFGSKFSADRWGVVGAELAKKAGAPVKLMLERDAELTVAGDRPSAYAEIEIGATADGKVTAWRSKSWGSGGPGGSGSPPIPYVFQVPNRRHQHTSVPTHKASARAWRAPGHPQACYLSLSALDDLAAALKMNPLDFILKNQDILGNLSKTYVEELEVADQLMGWRERWRPRGASQGPVRHGLGLSLHTWGGRGHRSNCDVTVHPDGTTEARMSTQDLGTGTRTVIAIVLAETLGLPLEAVKVQIGDSKLPASGGSGGSTTVGGISSSTRRAAKNALVQVFEKAAPKLGVNPDQLEAVDGVIRVQGDPSKSLTWRQSLGTNPVNASGSNPGAQGEPELTNSGAGGVQMAEVTVDEETGVVRMEKMVAVQDCGLIIDLKTAESQVYGSLIMGVSYALSEEKVTDPLTGTMLNVDFESYRLAGIGDVGELVVHMMTGPGYDERGVIGLGEPPVISPGAAIANAVANALGVRVPTLPLTPQRVLDALDAARGGKA